MWKKNKGKWFKTILESNLILLISKLSEGKLDRIWVTIKASRISLIVQIKFTTQ